MKKALPILSIILIMLIGLCGVAYGLAYVLNYPLPLLPKEEKPDYSSQISLMNSWENVRIYQMKDRPDTVEEIIQEAEPETIVDTSEQLFYSLFPEIDKASMNTYIQTNPESIENGYGRLFIDFSEKDITPTGIKTQHGDDVLTIDVHDNLAIIGIQADETENTGKLVILKNPKQLSLEIVNDINYWSKVSSIVDDNEGILGIPASGYNYFESGNYFTVKGMLVKDGDTIRKSVNPSMSVGMDENGVMYFGESVDVEAIDTAVEALDILVQDGQNMAADENEAQRLARVVIGQSKDGTILMLVTDGSNTASEKGFTLSEAASIMLKYGADNAASLIGGNRSSLYWNGKVLNNGEGFDADSFLVPNIFMIKAFDGEKEGIIYSDATSNKSEGANETEELIGPEEEKTVE